VAQWDVIVIGGGPAGSAAAITAARAGARVLLAEAGRYPRHKVCGEFISGEALATLEKLLGGATELLAKAPRIDRARIHIGGRELEGAVTPPGASISRYDLDCALWQAAQAAGVECRQDARVVSAVAAGDAAILKIEQQPYTAAAAVNASGRWSNLNASPALTRDSWLGLKAHFSEACVTAAPAVRDEEGTTDLYCFPGGYCGVQPVRDGSELRVNVCALVRASTARHIRDVLQLHPSLAARSAGWQLATEQVATAPVLFHDISTQCDGMLLAGDAATFIDPFVGDGISIALRSGALAGATAARVASRQISLSTGLDEYDGRYRAAFEPAFRNARRLRRLLEAPNFLRAPAVEVLRLFGVTDLLIRKTRAAG